MAINGDNVYVFDIFNEDILNCSINTLNLSALLLINKLFSINKYFFTSTLITISYYYTRATPGCRPENCQANEIKLNDEQIIFYNKILQSVNNEDGKLFFIDAPAGTRKTFLINLLLAKIKMANKEHTAVASSGIAATLLLNCRTAHSIVKIPIQLNEDSICSIKNN